MLIYFIQSIHIIESLLYAKCALGTGQAYALMGNSLIRETDINTIFIQNV